MRVSTTMLCLSVFLLTGTPCSLQAQVRDTQEVTKSCRSFVQGFFDWYVPDWLTKNLDSPSAFKRWEGSRDPQKHTGYTFSSELERRLKEDYAAQARVKGEIVGLDFDPFIGGNAGPLGRYVVGKITPEGAGYLAEVHLDRGETGKKPVVAAEVAFENEQWVFVNFHYYDYEEGKLTQHFNLLNTLKELREERRKPGLLTSSVPTFN